MFHYTETKPQTWRAVAAFDDGSECLLCLARSSVQVRDACTAAFSDVLETAERARVRSVSLERWEGAPDQGRWVRKDALAPPAGSPAPSDTPSATPGSKPARPGRGRARKTRA